MLWTAVLSLENHPLYPVVVYTNNVSHYWTDDEVNTIFKMDQQWALYLI
jgi:hypothetical protein